MKTHLTLFAILATLAACRTTPGTRLPRCTTPLAAPADPHVLHGTGATLWAAREDGLKSMANSKARLLKLWRRADGLWPDIVEGRAVPRATSFRAYLDRALQLSSDCRTIRACMVKGQVHAWSRCASTGDRLRPFEALVQQLEKALPPWAKVAVVTAPLVRTPSMGAQLLSQLVEDAILRSEGRRRLKLIHHRDVGALLWDLVPFSTVDRSLLWSRDAHYLLVPTLLGRRVRWEVFSLTDAFPARMLRGEVSLPTALATFLSGHGAVPATPPQTGDPATAVLRYLRSPDKDGVQALDAACRSGAADVCILAVTGSLARRKGDLATVQAAIRRLSPHVARGLPRALTARGMLHLANATALMVDLLMSKKGGARVGTLAMKERALAVAIFRRSCSAGEPQACIKAARLLNAGEVLTVLGEKSRLYETACNAGMPRGCAEAGCFTCYLTIMNHKKLNPYAPTYFSRYLAMVRGACSHGRPGGCLTLGQQQKIATLERLKAFEQACAWGYSAVCFGAGNGNLNPDVVKAPDRLRALGFFTLGCDDDDTKSCDARADVLLELGRSNEAVRVLTQACEHKLLGSCLKLGTIYEQGEHVLRDLRQAARLYEKAGAEKGTDEGSLFLKNTAFARLGHLYLKGLGVSRSVEHGIRLLTSACEARVPFGCHHLALHRLATKKPGESDAALKSLETACERGFTPSCRWLASRHDAAGQHIPAAQALVKACGGGDGEACFEAALRFAEGRNIPRSGETAFKLMSHGCSVLDHADSCLTLANHLYRTAPEKGKADAVALVRPVCFRGSAHACRFWAMVSGAPGTVRKHLARQCSGGNIMGCVSWSHVMSGMKPFAADPRAAAGLLLTACKAGHIPSCVGFGARNFNGAGIPKSPVLAHKYYKLACDRGYAVGCNNLGWVHERAPRFRDLPKALFYYEMACRAGHAEACNNAGNVYLLDMLRGSPRFGGRPMAMKRFTKACRLGFAGGCHALAVTLGGRGATAADLEKAVTFLMKSCKMGMKVSCRMLDAYRARLVKTTPRRRPGTRHHPRRRPSTRKR